MTPQLTPSSTLKVSLSTLTRSESFQTSLARRRELVRQAKPLFVAMLCTDPWFKARENDERFWSSFIGSRMAAARNLVEASKAASTKA